MFEGPLLDDMDERNNPSWLMSPIWSMIDNGLQLKESSSISGPTDSI